MYIRQSVFFSSDILQTRSDFGKIPHFGHIHSTKNLLEYKLRKSKNRFRYFYGQYLIAQFFLKKCTSRNRYKWDDKDADRTENGQNGVQRYKTSNFETNFLLGTL